MKLKQETKAQKIKRQSKVDPCCEETVYLREKVESQKRTIKNLRELTGNLLSRIYDAEHVMFLPQGQGGVPDSSEAFLKYNEKWHPSENMVVKINATKA